MRLGQPHVQRHQSRLGPEAKQRQQKCGRSPERRERGVAHRVERELPASALQHPKAEQNAQRADVRHQQIEEARATNLRNTMLRSDQKIRTQRHGLPRHHKQIGVVGEDHHNHAGKEDVILQAHQARRGALADAEVPG